MAQEPYENEGTVSDYQFTDEHEKTAYEYQNKKSPKINKKILLIIVVVLVIIFAGYKVISSLFKSHPETVATKVLGPASLPSAPSGNIANLTSVAATAPAGLSTATPQATALSVQAGDTVTQALAKLQTQTNALQTMLNNLQTDTQNKLSNLQQNVTDLTTQLQSINQAVQTLTQQSQVQQQQSQAAANARADAMQQQLAAIRAQKQYIVEAVIPGRAWLKGKDGSAITVARGDTITGYGQVVAIDPYSGTVTTSSGMTIPYGVSTN